jgi:hypothetical protein
MHLRVNRKSSGNASASAISARACTHKYVFACQVFGLPKIVCQVILNFCINYLASPSQLYRRALNRSAQKIAQKLYAH